MAAGAGWSALGAAIQSGMGGFAQRQQQIIEKARADSQQKLLDESVAEAPLRRAQAIANQALLQDKVTEIPKIHAQGDVDLLTKQLGDSRFNDPGYVKAMELSGNPLQTQDVQLGRVRDLESGAGNPVPSTSQMASQMGVAPNTGAPLPSDVQMRQKDDARKSAIDDMTTAAMRSAFGQGGQGGGGFELNPDGTPKDSPRNRQLGGMLGANDPVTKIYGPAGQSPQNVADRDRAAAAVKAEVQPALMQRVTGQMGAMVDNLTTAQRELERMYPGIEKSVNLMPDGTDKGTGQYNGALDLAKAKGQRLLYNFKYTPYNKAIQAASLANVTGWGTIVPGRINAQIVDKLKEHQSAFGNETPLATYQRNKELIEMTGRNKQDLMAAGQPHTPPPPNVPGVEAPPPEAPVAPAPPAPAGRPPMRVEGNPQFDAPRAPRTQLKPGDTIPMSEVAARAAKLGIDPNKFAAGLLAGGVKVLK